MTLCSQSTSVYIYKGLHILGLGRDPVTQDSDVHATAQPRGEVTSSPGFLLPPEMNKCISNRRREPGDEVRGERCIRLLSIDSCMYV